jgi:18S rRNA (guanine1575-N7)-methyltransferase
MTHRAIELLQLNENDPPSFILDIGCGSGLSGECLEELGHLWVGLDISEDMLSKSYTPIMFISWYF